MEIISCFPKHNFKKARSLMCKKPSLLKLLINTVEVGEAEVFNCIELPSYPALLSAIKRNVVFL